MNVRVRFAPSPTGYVHIGSLRTALYNYLYAQQNKGAYIIRVEDTDQTRLVDDAIEGMLKSMRWAGIDNDEGPAITGLDEIISKGDFGPYVQSQRLEIYQKYAEELVENGHAYHCFCSKERLDRLRETQKNDGMTSKYDGHCKHLSQEEINIKIKAGEPHVIRLNLPENREIEFVDRIKGRVTVNTSDLDDQVLMKTDGFPTYHMAVVIDDHLMEISHVVRGDEWLISTPKHIYLYEAFGWNPPEYVHLPVILNQSKKKLSKREGDVAVEDFRKKGYLPEALINYIALVGWSPETDEEIFSMTELIEQFSFERVSKSGGVFDIDKLNWMNNHYIKNYDLEKLTDLLMPYYIEHGYIDESEFLSKRTWLIKVTDTLRERLNKLSDVESYKSLFIGNDTIIENEEAITVINEVGVKALIQVFYDKIEATETLTVESVKVILKSIQKELKVKGKQLYMPVRVAITGQVHGPDIAMVMELIGKEVALSRVEYTLNNHIK